jgi:hypothetical protein
MMFHRQDLGVPEIGLKAELIEQEIFAKRDHVDRHGWMDELVNQGKKENK